jgi:hypothetical protein
MASLYNRARVTTSTTGTGTVTLGAAFAGYFTFAEAGVQDADVVAYTIEDGNDFEIGTGTYTASGTTLTRTVTESKIGGVAGTSAINLSGSATVFITARAEDISGDVVGPASATDNAIARYDGTTGKIIQDSGVIIDDSDNVSGVVDLTLSGSVTVDPGSDIDADIFSVDVTGAPTFSWDESADAFRSSKPLVISDDGNGDITHTVAGAAVVSQMELHSSGSSALGGLTVHRHSDASGLGGHLLFLKSAGTHASPTVPADQSVIMGLYGALFDGTDYELAAAIQFYVDGTAGNNDAPGGMRFFTNAGSQLLVEWLEVGADQIAIFANTPLVGANAVLDAGDIGVSVQAFDADTLFADTPDTLTAGFAHTVDNDGTQSSGTYTPDQDGGNMKRIVNGGAFTLAPPTDDCCIIVQITNNASAGAITTSGFTGVFGDAFTTTDGDDFICTIIKINGFSSLTVQDVS